MLKIFGRKFLERPHRSHICVVKCHLHLMFCTIHRYKKWFEDLLPKWCHLLCELRTALLECASCVFLEGSLRGPIFSLEIFSLKIFISSLLASTAAPCEWAAKKVPQAGTRSPGLQRQRRRRGEEVYTRGSGFPWRCSPPPECSRVVHLCRVQPPTPRTSLHNEWERRRL